MTENWSTKIHPLDTERIMRTLSEHDVSYVLVGGMAALMHRWSGSTADLDIVPSASTANLNRLGSALRALHAVVWTDAERHDLFQDGKPLEADEFGYTAEGLRRAHVWHLTSDAGLIDIAFAIEGVGGHPDLERNAITFDVFMCAVRVASLDDIIASKRALARPKDLRVLPELTDLRDEQRRRIANPP